MKQYVFSDEGFAVLALVAFSTWIVSAYWQFKLIRRANIVARTQHPIPENVPWHKRARLAVEADAGCQKIMKCRNRAVLAFLLILIGEAVILAVAGFTSEY